MQTGTITQIAIFNAKPLAVYNLMLDEKLHTAFTGSPASVSVEPNGKFSVYDGYCTGYNIELVNGEKIVQAWHFEEVEWPEDHLSICTFLFEANGNQTKLSFIQTDIPKQYVEALESGWKDFYWELMQAYLENH